MTQSIQRVDHITFIFYPENAEGEVARLESTLGVNIPPSPPLSPVIRLWVDFASGLEVITPIGRADEVGATGEDAAILDKLYEHLDTRGEGVITVVFGVADLDAAVRRADQAGATIGGRYTSPPPAAEDLLDGFEEVEIGPLAGVNFLLGRVVLKGEAPST